jgi:hypothetical protein
MASITPENLTVKFNLKGSVILGIDEYNELRLHAGMYDGMLASCLESFKVVEKEPSNWSPSICTVEGQFKIPTSIFNAVVNSIVDSLLNNDAWMRSLAKTGEHWLDLKEGMLATYRPSGEYTCDLLDVPQFAERYFEIQKEDEDE